MVLGLLAMGVSQLEFLMKYPFVLQISKIREFVSSRVVNNLWIAFAISDSIVFLLKAVAIFIGSIIVGIGGLGEQRIMKFVWILALLFYDNICLLIMWGGKWFWEFYSSIYSGPARGYIMISNIVFIVVVVLTGLWGIKVGEEIRNRIPQLSKYFNKRQTSNNGK